MKRRVVRTAQSRGARSRRASRGGLQEDTTLSTLLQGGIVVGYDDRLLPVGWMFGGWGECPTAKATCW